MTLGARMPTQCFFVIIFEGRTGSSYTVSCLNSHPNIFCYPEVLAHHSLEIQQKILKRVAHGQKIEGLPQVRLNQRYFHGDLQPENTFQAVGFKTKLHDVADVSRFYDYLHQNKFCLIYLKRRNVIKSAISMLNAHRMVRTFGPAHWNASDQKQVQGAFYISPGALLKQLEARICYEKWHQTFFTAYKKKKKVFYYEDLLQNERDFFFQILDFLGVDDAKMEGRFFKNTPDRLEDAILNYDEIRHLFAGTYFDRFFEENGDDYGA